MCMATNSKCQGNITEKYYFISILFQFWCQQWCHSFLNGDAAVSMTRYVYESEKELIGNLNSACKCIYYKSYFLLIEMLIGDSVSHARSAQQVHN